MPSIPGVADPVAERHPRFPGNVPGEAGIYIFILGDMLLYTLLFGSFMVDRRGNVNLYNASADTLHVTFGMINALLLLTASLLVFWGVRSVRENLTPRRAPRFFVGAIVCSLGFIGNKYFEYAGLICEGHTPVENAFYTYYFVLTGIHLTHLVAGTLVLIFLWRVASKKARTRTDIRAMESGAAFWHVVDLLWIMLFALLFLVR